MSLGHGHVELHNTPKDYLDVHNEARKESSGDLTGVNSVKLWLEEKEFYDYKNNKCVKDECMHYVQCVWNTTESVGCARTKCDNNWMYVICSYYPAGNIVGFLPY
ncbi:hypothetical protein ACSQ67_004238 [Phaseolus vulgaris]